MEEKSWSLNAGANRVYYFNIKTSKNGDKYLKIREYNTQTRKGTGITIWDEHTTKFYSALQEVLAEMKFDESP